MFIDGNRTVNVGGGIIDFSEPRVMAIVNVTSDSFYAGSRNTTDFEIEQTVVRAINQGADILDIGAVSTRPGSLPPNIDIEVAGVMRALEIVRRVDEKIAVSVDSYRGEVVEQVCAKYGAVIVNDVSGGTMDLKMFDTVARLGLPYVLGHIKGTPSNMNNFAHYEDLMGELITFFVTQIGKARDAGVKDIMIDPCFGFAKTVEQNFVLLKHYGELGLFSLPVVASLSRKSVIYKTLGTTAEEALIGTAALNWQALCGGASMLRVHDVREAKEVIKLWNAYNCVQ